MGCRLVAVSVKIGGNRRLPIGKENTALRSCSQANRRRRLPLYDLLRTDYGDEDPLRAQERDEEDSFWRQVLFCV